MTADPVSFANVERAARRIAQSIHRTPVITSRALDEASGRRLFFKCENLQRAGAFKVRGAMNAVATLREAGSAGIVATHSSGNHGTALALAAKEGGLKAVVVMPENSAGPKIAAVRRNGAEVVLCKPGRIAREAALAGVVETRCAEVVHPYDDARVIAGQGTATLELLAEEPELDAIVVPVGGGGLLSGTLIAAHGLKPGLAVFGVEPEQADDAARSLAAGERILVDAPDTIADGLRASLGVLTFDIARRHCRAIVTVSEAEIVDAMRRFLECTKLLIEASSAVPVAALLTGRLPPQFRRVGVIITGGNVDLDRLPWRKPA
ncbi:MAG TPA: pyridoxal-phosphate dependent enzyme [Steroidobacteraceae bacterium]|nr:pyridoxal-phosphate dependent enzyme [Steroidobacteraceae bacterium]